ncbi:hypothetical protein Hc94105_0260 [Helicobacter cinaedi]|uniref:hypothetical protein n=1 Tax=Helicobacter cinaedi TaxID=213 RepID=UPI001F3ECBBD|nr:hypothetical protein [Helicobacter cinaedi]BDB66075.1 hypothetical protein Hc94105_0260 [Helicobacter cinaedi]
MSKNVWVEAEIDLGDLLTRDLLSEIADRAERNPSILDELEDTLHRRNSSKILETISSLYSWKNQDYAREVFERLDSSLNLKEWILKNYGGNK